VINRCFLVIVLVSGAWLAMVIGFLL
jgi:hypothetical protein